MTPYLFSIKTQKGAATLLTSVILLIAITLVAFLSGKTVLNETKIAADNYRTSQAVAAANYAMDYAINYFDNGGFDQNNNNVNDTSSTDLALGTPPFVLPPALTSSDGSQTTSATVTFDNTVCGASGANFSNGMITATGFSDDGTASRTISQCVGPLQIFRNNDAPDQPLISRASIGLTGNARIINRYTNTTVWAGGPTKIGSSSSMETYIKDSVSGVLTNAELLDPGTSSSVPNAQLASNRNLGNGLDIIDNDPNLGLLSGLEFFTNFFAVDSRAQLKAMAQPAPYTVANAQNKSGLLWIEGDSSMTGGTIGSLTSPAIVVVNGDFSIGGGATIYGLLYVAGTYTVNGTPQIIGSNVVEGTDLSDETPAGDPIVSGTGTISLVFWPAFGDSSGSSELTPGLGAVVSGSWRDW